MTAFFVLGAIGVIYAGIGVAARRRLAPTDVPLLFWPLAVYVHHAIAAVRRGY